MITTTCKDSQMSCCRCNKSGRCTNCVCVKSSRKCSTCLPKQMGHCRNQAETSLDSTESAPCTTSVSNQNQGEQVTAEICLLTGLPQQQPVEIPRKVTTEEESQLPAPNPLPPFEPAQLTNFTWGVWTAEEVSTTLSNIYDEIAHWRRNLFKVTSGKQSKLFVIELARLFQSYADQSALEAVALKAAMILSTLVLQKPFRTSKSKDHIACIKRRMNHWHASNFKAILEEGRAIQGRLIRSKNRMGDDNDARRFAELMMKGRLREATKLLSGNGRSLTPWQ